MRLAKLLPMPLGCMALQAPLLLLAPQYKIDHYYEPYNQSPRNEEPPLHRVLCDIDPGNFPSPTQARKAIQHGRLLVMGANNGCTISKDGFVSNEMILDLGIAANSTTILQDKDIVAIRSRLPNDFYPQSCTQYVDPPCNAAAIFSTRTTIVFEDDHIAIVNKPEGMDTIGEKRHDLQSTLPFLLHPPIPAKRKKKPKQQQFYLPRPVHRLDRRTGGCVLVAKSEKSMKQFSRLFATRQIQKSYCAITFGEPKPDHDDRIDVNGKAFSVIDYPIDDKDAVTLWRVVTTVTSPTWGQLSLLHLLPKTGRNHQIRRHLSYCLSCPIVGDSKYDGGGKLAKAARELGMFLFSNSMEFAHVMLLEESTVSANIPLPDKFYEILGESKGEVLI